MTFRFSLKINKYTDLRNRKLRKKTEMRKMTEF